MVWGDEPQKETSRWRERAVTLCSVTDDLRRTSAGTCECKPKIMQLKIALFKTTFFSQNTQCVALNRMRHLCEQTETCQAHSWINGQVPGFISSVLVNYQTKRKWRRRYRKKLPPEGLFPQLDLYGPLKHTHTLSHTQENTAKQTQIHSNAKTECAEFHMLNWIFSRLTEKQQCPKTLCSCPHTCIHTETWLVMSL